MQQRITACRFLLIGPALFLMLQLAFALHHHHSYSLHDDHDGFHSVSTSIAKKVCAAYDFHLALPAQMPKYSPLAIQTVTIVSPPPVTAHITSASPSRAPPTLL